MSTKVQCRECERLKAVASDLAEALTIHLHVGRVFKLRGYEHEIVMLLLAYDEVTDDSIIAILPNCDPMKSGVSGWISKLRNLFEPYGVGILRRSTNADRVGSYFIPPEGKRFIKDIVLERVAEEMGIRVKRTPRPLRSKRNRPGKRTGTGANGMSVVAGMYDPLARALVAAHNFANVVAPHNHNSGSRAAGRTSPPRPVAR